MKVLQSFAALAAVQETVSAMNAPLKGAKRRHAHDGFFQMKRAATNETLDTYDYVVVGSGPGGGPVAANLAMAGYKVLLIDAGGDSGQSLTETIPAMHLFSTEFEDTKWDYFVNHYSDLARQERDSKMTYRQTDGSLYVGRDPPADAEPLGILYPRTGTLGGCSRHNALIAIQASDSDWDSIANLTGDDSWKADNMRTYFERIEKNRYLPSSIVGHGYSGWLTTSLTTLSLVVEDRKLLSLIIAAATATGKSLAGLVLSTVAGLAQILTSDINAPGQTLHTGLYQVPLTMEDNVRGGPRNLILDTANAVDDSGARKYHLDIKLNTLVTKVLFNETGETPRATGVAFLQGASLYRADPRSGSASITGSGTVRASREVIVAAGTFNTPQLLKLSGIGPRSELESFGIDTLVDLPGVGTNMQDRYEVTVVGKSQTDFAITSDCTFLKTQDDPCLETYQAGVDPVTRGAYGTSGLAVAVLLETSSSATGEPDVLVAGAPGRFTGYYPGYSNASLADARHWAWIVLKSHSRNTGGTVTLRSTDPRDVPQIDFHYFDTGVNGHGESDLDLQAVYEGFNFGRKAFSSLIPLDGSFDEVWPGSNTSAEADVKQFLQDEAWGHHASCTCPIGADDDPNAVLTSDFRVRGTQGLRVVDASIFPKIPGYFIVLPLYMVSEKASEVIIQEAEAASRK